MVTAVGNLTQVQSISNVSNINGMQNAFNQQTANVQGTGSGSSNAGSVAMMKKRRRRGLQVLSNILVAEKTGNTFSLLSLETVPSYSLF
jgi:hypothetical protein